MKQPDRTIEYNGIEITIVHGWILGEWGAAWSIGKRHYWHPGFPTAQAAEMRAKQLIDVERELHHE